MLLGAGAALVDASHIIWATLLIHNSATGALIMCTCRSALGAKGSPVLLGAGAALVDASHIIWATLLIHNSATGALTTCTCRSALGAKGSPVLLGAGASLAAAFLERRMAAGDPVVLQRLMRLLTAPLSAMEDQTEVPSPDVLNLVISVMFNKRCLRRVSSFGGCFTQWPMVTTAGTGPSADVPCNTAELSGGRFWKHKGASPSGKHSPDAHPTKGAVEGRQALAAMLHSG